jgi:hypothetical protein
MDIGEQQRVIIVEVDESTNKPDPAEEPQPVRTPDTAAAWPLPLDLESEPVG